jgi:hypothetical protein
MPKKFPTSNSSGQCLRFTAHNPPLTILAILFYRTGRWARSGHFSVFQQVKTMMSATNGVYSNHGSSVQQGTLPAQEGGKALKPKKLHGRAFYESLGSPRLVLAPMVDQSEFVLLHLLLKMPY